MSVTQVGVTSNTRMPSRVAIDSQLLKIQNDIHKYWFLIIYFKRGYACDVQEVPEEKGGRRPIL